MLPGDELKERALSPSDAKWPKTPSRNAVIVDMEDESTPQKGSPNCPQKGQKRLGIRTDSHDDDVIS